MNKFDEYANRYDMSIPEIEYKYHHSYRVMDNMIVLAKSMNLPYTDIELARCIGILHDIARFEQFKRFHSFKDGYLDHGDYAITIIKEENILDSFNISKDDYEVVYKAIKNHNKYKIEEGLNKRELLFAKMIRDADKLDILYALSNPDLKNVIREDDSEIRESISNDFLNNRQAIRDNTENKNENIIIMFSFVYDFNFSISLNIIKHKKYYDKIYDRLNDKHKFKKYIDHLKEYIEERTE